MKAFNWGSPIFIALVLTGCGGGGSSSSDSSSTPQSVTPQPSAPFTVSELTAHPVYTSASPTTNVFEYIDLFTFNADGTISEAINMTTTDTASASTVLHGTYSVGSDGVLTITIPGKAVEKEWKTSAALDSYQSFYLKSNVSTVTTRWFFDPSLGGAQAYAYAHGQTMPVSH